MHCCSDQDKDNICEIARIDLDAGVLLTSCFILRNIVLVPIYDFSDLSFDLNKDMVGHNVSSRFAQLNREGAPNTPALIAYYPSVYVRDGMTVVNLNIKWLGVI